MFLVWSCSCLCPIHWSHVLSWEWRCSWSSADRRCSSYIWVINNLISHKGATYIGDLTVYYIDTMIQLQETISSSFRVFGADDETNCTITWCGCIYLILEKKWPPICRLQFQMSFRERNLVCFVSNSPEICFVGSSWQQVCIGSVMVRYCTIYYGYNVGNPFWSRLRITLNMLMYH